ncbi:MAG: MFS transporter, partial [Zoogloeaceae bacterium]|nr:MFS transporter [Zoogloeaceae bacterium]
VSIPVGAVLAEFLGWRAALAALAVFGAVSLGMVAMRFEETLKSPNPRALSPAALVRNWAGILSNRTFWAFALLAMMSYGGLFTFLAASSFVFMELMDISKPLYGVLMFTMAVSYLLGTFLCRWLLRRHGVHRAVAIGGGLSLAGGSLIGLLALAGAEGVWAIMLPVYLFMLGHGVHQPCGQSGAVGPFPHAAGAASALSGFLMMLSAFAMGSWLGANMDGTRFPLTNGMWFWGVMTALVAWGLVYRSRPRPA